MFWFRGRNFRWSGHLPIINKDNRCWPKYDRIPIAQEVSQIGGRDKNFSAVPFISNQLFLLQSVLSHASKPMWRVLHRSNIWVSRTDTYKFRPCQSLIMNWFSEKLEIYSVNAVLRMFKLHCPGSARLEMYTQIAFVVARRVLFYNAQVLFGDREGERRRGHLVWTCRLGGGHNMQRYSYIWTLSKKKSIQRILESLFPAVASAKLRAVCACVFSFRSSRDHHPPPAAVHGLVRWTIQSNNVCVRSSKSSSAARFSAVQDS